MRRKTTEEFIKDAKKVHGNRYDYSKVDYIDNKTKIIIICFNHGEFFQIPSSHLNKNGCPKCVKSYRPNNNEFIKKAEKIHGNRYDYNKTEYKTAKNKIIIICKEHGEFLQTPDSHLKGCGCPKCVIKKKNYTTKEFIEKARKVHGDKYDYSKVEYINSQSKIIIICKEHEEFLQTPVSHLGNHGCSKCAGNKIEFIEDAKKIHGNRYDYSKAKYNGIFKKVIIICKEHGEFLQTARSHLKGNGCSKCSKRYSPNTKEFIEKARKVHGNKYDYSKTKYKASDKKITITCKKHGDFFQTAGNHLSGKGCSKCIKRKKKTTEEFIKEAVEIHGNKYDYSKTKYNGVNEKIVIICKEHGEFLQTPHGHLSGKGCLKCGYNTKTTEEFIKQAIEVHENKYNYSKTNYINSNTKVKIICSKHGEFLQHPNNHLNGQSCPKCNGSISKISQKWLDEQKVPKNCREITIYCGEKKFIVDGYIKETNTIYEFNGDYWHGNPELFSKRKINKNRNKTFGELYKETIEKKQLLKSAGYKIIDIWESEYKKMVKYEEI